MDNKKSIFLLIGILVVCAIVITIGVFTEKNNDVVTDPNIIREEQNETAEPTAEIDPTTTPSEENNVEEIMTAENNSDLSSMLASTDIAVFKSFSDQYKNKTIEFDGCIVYLDNHDDYDTRYDIMMYAGDYVDENTANPGPMFRFENVNTYDLGIKDLYLPSFVSVGTNIHIVAEVNGYDADTDLFELKPVSIEER